MDENNIVEESSQPLESPKSPITLISKSHSVASPLTHSSKISTDEEGSKPAKKDPKNQSIMNFSQNFSLKKFVKTGV